MTLIGFTPAGFSPFPFSRSFSPFPPELQTTLCNPIRCASFSLSLALLFPSTTVFYFRQSQSHPVVDHANNYYCTFLNKYPISIQLYKLYHTVNLFIFSDDENLIRTPRRSEKNFYFLKSKLLTNILTIYITSHNQLLHFLRS